MGQLPFKKKKKKTHTHTHTRTRGTQGRKKGVLTQMQLISIRLVKEKI